MWWVRLLHLRLGGFPVIQCWNFCLLKSWPCLKGLLMFVVSTQFEGNQSFFTCRFTAELLFRFTALFRYGGSGPAIPPKLVGDSKDSEVLVYRTYHVYMTEIGRLQELIACQGCHPGTQISGRSLQDSGAKVWSWLSWHYNDGSVWKPFEWSQKLCISTYVLYCIYTYVRAQIHCGLLPVMDTPIQGHDFSSGHRTIHVQS